MKINNVYKTAGTVHNMAGRLEKWLVIVAFGVTIVKVGAALVMDASKKH